MPVAILASNSASHCGWDELLRTSDQQPTSCDSRGDHAGLEYRDFSGQHRPRGDHSRNTPVAIGQVGCDLQPARPTNAHALDTVEKAIHEGTAVNPDVGDEGLALVVEPRDACWAPCGLPPDRFSPVQPQTKADAIVVLAPH